MRNLLGRSHRSKKSVEEIIEEFQNEWDELEFQEESSEEEDIEKTYDGEPIAEAEEDYEEVYEDFSQEETLTEDPVIYDENIPEGECKEEYQEEYPEEYQEKYEEEYGEYEPEEENIPEEECQEEYKEEYQEEYQEKYEEEYSEYEPEEENIPEEECREEYQEEYQEKYEEEYGEYEQNQEFAEEDDTYRDEELTASSRKQKEREEKEDRILDRFILIAGAAVLLMAIITGVVLIGSRLRSGDEKQYQDAGATLVELPGGQGLEAIADAQQDLVAMQMAMVTPEPTKSPEPEGYDEQEYTPDIRVQLSFSSIEKDLKIKFLNKETGKLISNVPFSIMITDPNGTTSMWSDDDMDGIIYKKGLTPGQYRLVMNELEDEKYKSYGLVAGEQKTEVKKEIEYKKVDVSDEVKTEAQVDVAKEDTKINETTIENYLQDTVDWVESTSTMISYAEVAKSNIPDPMTLAVSSSFIRLSQENPETEIPTPAPTDSQTMTEVPTPAPTEAPTAAPTEAPTAAPTEAPTATPTEAPTAAPTEAPTAAPTEAPTAAPTEAPTAAPTEAPTPIPTEMPTPVPTIQPSATPAVYQSKIDPSSKNLAVGESFVLTASCEGVTIQDIIWSSNNPGAVTVDGSGKVTAVAISEQPVLISYFASGIDAAGNHISGLTASCSVTVNGSMSLRLDKATEVVYTGTPITLTATLENGPESAVLTVESSDIAVAKAEISGKTVTVTGLTAGTASITVKYTENGQTLSAACAVTVKQNPRENKTALLKDKDGNELFVLENGNYRQAYYADYYTADKFFKKGEAKYTGWQTLNGTVKYFNKDGIAVTGEQVIQGVKYNFASDGSLMTGSGIMGIDVSKWNGDIDWSAVKNSGVSYVIIRCGYRGSSQGTLIVDPKFKSNIKGATDAGLKVGVYFFTQAVDRVEAVEEASMVLDMIKNYHISYPVFLDVEPSGGRADSISKETRTEVCKAFCQTVQNAGYTAGIYANKTWLTEKIDTSQLGGYKIWLAQYASAPTYTGRYDLWQYKSIGKVSGINGDVDLNLSYLGY